MQTTLESNEEALRDKLARLEEGPAVVGDWHRLEASAARALIGAQYELSAIQAEMLDSVRSSPPDPRWHARQRRLQDMREMMDELRLIRMCAQSRLFEIEAEASQTSFRDAL